VFNSTTKNPDDVVITLAIRTPLAKAHKGGFKDTPLDGIVYKLMKEVVNRMKIDPALVEDICLGNVRLHRPPYIRMSQHDVSHASRTSPVRVC
jgi:acetyl-CoA acetyltransferase